MSKRLVDPSSLGELLPLGGASVLLIYLLRVWVGERAAWRAERLELVEEHRKNMAEAEAECERQKAYWQRRTHELETDLQVMLGRRSAQIRDGKPAATDEPPS